MPCRRLHLRVRHVIMPRYSCLPHRTILNGGGCDWRHGQHGCKSGVARYGGWTTPSVGEGNNTAPHTDWVVQCGNNDEASDWRQV